MSIAFGGFGVPCSQSKGLSKLSTLSTRKIIWKFFGSVEIWTQAAHWEALTLPLCNAAPSLSIVDRGLGCCRGLWYCFVENKNGKYQKKPGLPPARANSYCRIISGVGIKTYNSTALWYETSYRWQLGKLSPNGFFKTFYLLVIHILNWKLRNFGRCIKISFCATEWKNSDAFIRLF